MHWPPHNTRKKLWHSKSHLIIKKKQKPSTYTHSYAVKLLDGIGTVAPNLGNKDTAKGPLSDQTLCEVPRTVAQLAVAEDEGAESGMGRRRMRVQGREEGGLPLRGIPPARRWGWGVLERLRREGGGAIFCGTEGMDPGRCGGLERGQDGGGRGRRERVEAEGRMGGAKGRRGGA